MAPGGKVFQVRVTEVVSVTGCPLRTTPVRTLGVVVPPALPLAKFIGVGVTVNEPVPMRKVVLTVVQLLWLPVSQTV